MKYTTYNFQQLANRKGKPWQARAKYKDANGKWKEVSKMLPEAKGKKEAMRMAKEWFDKLNAEADLMPNAGKASRAMTLDTYGDANADALNLASVKLKDTFNENTDYFRIEEEQEEE